MKPSELALLVRLHLRTHQTLEAHLTRLRPLAEASTSDRAKGLLAQATKLLHSVRDGDGSGRECFELLQEVDLATGG